MYSVTIEGQDCFPASGLLFWSFNWQYVIEAEHYGIAESKQHTVKTFWFQQTAATPICSAYAAHYLCSVSASGKKASLSAWPIRSHYLKSHGVRSDA